MRIVGDMADRVDHAGAVDQRAKGTVALAEPCCGRGGAGAVGDIDV
jgi:hypothetical protein